MKIMWLCNILLKEFANKINQPSYYGGGWMESLSKDISKNNECKLIICAPYKKNELRKEEINGIIYYAFPINNMEKYLKIIYEEENPDIIHIHGTEFEHGYKMMQIAPNARYIVSIQGLVSIYAKHFYANVPNKIINKKTIAQIIIRDSIKNGKKDFEKRGIIEEKIIKNTKNIIGRTRWDRACTYNINPNAKYYYCGENLRTSFYQNKWNINEVEESSIFISQATYPIKGFHMFLEAYKEIAKDYPNSKVYVAGKDIIKNKTIKDKIMKRYYDKYIIKQIKKYELENNIIFTGPLSEKEMVQTMKKCKVMVSPSAIENSPNSVGEGLILGMPVIASNVGGLEDIINNGVDGLLYPYDEYYMLKYYIEMVFRDKELCNKLSINARKKAGKLYNREENMKELLKIYHTVLEG